MTTAGQTISVRVNDRARSVQPGVTLLGLLDELGYGERQGCAVAINAAVVPRPAWAELSLKEGDDVLIIQASQGG
ncbi:MAG: sulfur carrier protein ThiS [Polyangia bacterium]